MKHFLLILGVLSLFISGCVSFPDVPPSHGVIGNQSNITVVYNDENNSYGLYYNETSDDLIIGYIEDIIWLK